MVDFIEIEGASGARYRFRRLANGAAHQPTPGNYAFVRRDRTRFTVLLIGECIDLSDVRSEWPEGVRMSGVHIFTRLNVPQAIRRAEHDDLAARHPTAAMLHAAE